MATLSNGEGVFLLSDSDNHVGSFFSKEDLAEILEIDNLNGFYKSLESIGHFITNGYIDEKYLYKHFKTLKNEFSSIKLKKSVSFDECVLLAILKKTFPQAEIEQQVKVRNYIIDFKITYCGETKYIEFDGPSHFIPLYRNGKNLEDPFIRVKEVMEETGCELVRWPYWIQRCSRNAKIIFDTTLKGYGALWTTTKYFNDFSIPNPSETIKKLTRRFNAEDDNGIGYFYEASNNLRMKPAHKLIRSVLKDKNQLKKFLPSDADDKYYWIPKQLWNI